MAVTNTFSATADNSAWIEVIDGSTIASFGIEVDPTSTSVFLAVDQDTPDIGSDDYIVLQRERDTSISFALNESDKIYMRAPSTTVVKVRGYQVTR